jgi:ribonuclease P protein component
MVQCPGLAGPPRVGLVVSKSAGNAVTRNRIKRRLRHIVRTLPLKPGIDYVIIGASQVAEVSHPQLVGWLERALQGSFDA